MSTRLRLLAIVLSTLGLLGLAMPAHAGAGTAASGASGVSVAEARRLPLGTVVTVTGTTTTPPGAFESSFFDKGFGVQDLTGGIYVSVQASAGVALHRTVRVTGTLRESFGLLVIVADAPGSVRVLGPALPVLPLPVRTGDVDEDTEGRLVVTLARITRAPESDLPYGYKFYVDDGSGELTVFVNVQAGIDLGRLAAGRLVVVAGFGSQFDDHYEIDPRFPADVLPLTG